MPLIRNVDGFSTVNVGERHSDFKRPLPFDYQEYFEDFILGSSGIPFGWTNTNTNGTPTNASGTYLVQTLGGADNDVSHMYQTTATMNIGTGKRAHFRWRGKVDKGSGGTIGQEEVYIGLGGVQTTTNFVVAGGTALAVDNFLGFASYDATTNIAIVARASDVESTQTAAATYSDATFLELAFDYDGTTCTFFKDGNKIGTLTTNIPSAALSTHIHIKAGAAHAKVLTTDYIFVAIER